jgi:hypothetical protein
LKSIGKSTQASGVIDTVFISWTKNPANWF